METSRKAGRDNPLTSLTVIAALSAALVVYADGIVKTAARDAMASVGRATSAPENLYPEEPDATP